MGYDGLVEDMNAFLEKESEQTEPLDLNSAADQSQ